MMATDYLAMGASAAVLILVFYFLYSAFFNSKEQEDPEYEMKNLRIGNATVSVKVADTDEKRRVGLMNAASLSENEGMIFVFDYPAYHSFWMKDTLIPLEILFIDEDWKITDIKEMDPCEGVDCAAYSPSKKILYAVELNGNFSERHGISTGETVGFAE